MNANTNETVFNHFGIKTPAGFETFCLTPSDDFEAGKLHDCLLGLFWEVADGVCKANGLTVDEIYPDGAQTRVGRLYCDIDGWVFADVDNFLADETMEERVEYYRESAEADIEEHRHKEAIRAFEDSCDDAYYG